MRITLLQMDLAWADALTNREQAAQMIRSNPDSDIYLLPEMFTSGFCTQPAGIAEQADTQTLEWLLQMAAQCGGAVAGSVAVECGGRFFNRFYFVTPDGKYYTYDKRHLFTFGGEHLQYTAGTQRIIIEYRGIRILPLVCYDLRFPVWSRNTLPYYDLALYVASWPTPRIEVWDTLLRSMAIENACYVAGVNRVGTDPYCQYCGHSAVVGFKGDVITGHYTDGETTMSAELDFEKLKEFRAKFPVLDDADKFNIQ